LAYILRIEPPFYLDAHDFSGKNLKKIPSIDHRSGGGESGDDAFLLFCGTEVEVASLSLIVVCSKYIYIYRTKNNEMKSVMFQCSKPTKYKRYFTVRTYVRL